MSQDDRRAQILDAVVPVVLERGLAVTSKQLAEAAGVAEGTLYKSFGDKESLLRALVAREGRRGDDATAWLQSGGADGATLHELVEGIAIRGIAQYGRQFRLFQMLGALMQHPTGEELAEWERMLDPWIAALAERGDELGLAPDRAASILRMLVVAASHEGGWGVAMPADDVCRVFLHGVAAPAAVPA